MRTRSLILAIIVCLGSSLSFATANNKSKPCAGSEQPAAATASGDNKSNKSNQSPKDKKAKPAPSDQEKEFDRVLQGIYG